MFNHDRLRIARQRRAMTKKTLAEKLKVSARTVTGWEAGEYPPEPRKQRLLAEVLRFPVSFFELDDSAKVGIDAVSFRSLSTKTAGQRDAVKAMCDLAMDVSAWISARAELPAPAIPDMRGEDPAQVARMLRRQWGLGVQPVKNMLHLLEAKGVRVLALPETFREIDACSFWCGPTPVVLLNTEVSNERMRFDMAHELLHLVAHRHSSPFGKSAEDEANAFAREFLMPAEGIQAQRVRAWTLETLLIKKQLWNVSVSALAYRLHSLRLLSEWHFKSLNIEMQRRGYKDKEPFGTPHEQSRILELLLARMREKGMPLRFVANQLRLPVEELRGFFAGLARVSIEGLGESEEGPRATLRVVK
jgi:Zn-dependent peptidase ImmA (M78 family)/DNA-binding XRE family transcriptional regulator